MWPPVPRWCAGGRGRGCRRFLVASSQIRTPLPGGTRQRRSGHLGVPRRLGHLGVRAGGHAPPVKAAAAARTRKAARPSDLHVRLAFAIRGTVEARMPALPAKGAARTGLDTRADARLCPVVAPGGFDVEGRADVHGTRADPARDFARLSGRIGTHLSSREAVPRAAPIAPLRALSARRREPAAVKARARVSK
jgi:hypothetical protein